MHTIRIDAANLTAGPHGLDAAFVAGLDESVRAAQERLHSELASGLHGYLNAPGDDGALAALLEVAQPRLGRFRQLVVIGIGGSSLGLQCLMQALARPGDRHELYIVDTTDPWVFADLMVKLDLPASLFVVVSKSGRTLETVAALGFFAEKLRAAGLSLRKHMVAVTDRSGGPLRSFAEKQDLETAEIPASVGGRFSVLTAASLLPAALLHVDVAGLVAGAARARETCLNAEPEGNWPARLGLSAAEAARRGCRDLVFMPYSAKLRRCADWFTQLWDESLGKAGSGQAVIPAVGPADQHAQMQCFLDGPADKLLLFLRVARHEHDWHLGEFEWRGFDSAYLRGRAFSEVLNAQLAGTARACLERGRPNAILDLPVVDAATVGELLMGLMAATTFAAMAMGVNAYDQPAVELGKRISRSMLGG